MGQRCQFTTSCFLLSYRSCAPPISVALPWAGACSGFSFITCSWYLKILKLTNGFGLTCNKGIFLIWFSGSLFQIHFNEWRVSPLFSFWKKSQRKRKSWEQVSLEMGGKKEQEIKRGRYREEKKIGDCGLGRQILFAFHFSLGKPADGPALLVFSAAYVPLCPWKGRLVEFLLWSPHWPDSIIIGGWLVALVSLYVQMLAEVPSAETMREAGRINLNKAGSGNSQFGSRPPPPPRGFGWDLAISRGNLCFSNTLCSQSFQDHWVNGQTCWGRTVGG